MFILSKQSFVNPHTYPLGMLQKNINKSRKLWKPENPLLIKKSKKGSKNGEGVKPYFFALKQNPRTPS